ncbi:MAG: glycoside hydrolase family 3 C-terminal domain-containing protein [Clostridia bacterium]|nr:glycoside hydrolase family 3 C-terminal domain-containing protein [Clostridia bacterium]
MNIERIISEMTAEEKAALVAGTDFMYTNPIPRLGVPSLRMSDGPHGLRVQNGSGDNGVAGSDPATSFPTAAATASSRNPDIMRKMGKAIAEECRYYGVHTVLGPGVNIKRNPLCGRNFEYFSEDPYLAGVMGAAMIEGVQSAGVGVALKHFALNNSENYRFMGNSVASEKTMREIYLKPFEYIVKHAGPGAVMCAYNKINGTYCSENGWLLTDVLRNEWGFEGIVMSDWGAVNDRVKGLKAGMDLEMPGDTPMCRKWILDGLKDCSLPQEVIDASCRRILEWIDKYYAEERSNDPGFEAHHDLAAEIAADSAVLMTNDGVLPLNGNEKLAIRGELFENMRYQGAGSSMINPAFLNSPKDEFGKRGVKTVALEESDTVLYFAGLTEEYESEGLDRENMRLPEKQLKELDELCSLGKRIVVVLFGGAPVELPFCDKVNAILNMYLPGQNGGRAVYELLYGLKNPSGKLAETWPLKYEDVPSWETFGKTANEIYKEGTDVGYRYYNNHNVPVRFPFGHGLSYTTFEHSGWTKEGDAYTETVTNTGSRFGGEVVELYVGGELRSFKKVYLEPGESATVTLIPDKEDLMEYSDEYDVPAEIPSFPVTVDTRFADFGRTFLGRVLRDGILSYPKKEENAAAKLPDGTEKTNRLKGARFLRTVLESNSPRTLSMCGGKSFPYNLALGFTELANRHVLKGICCILKKIKVPVLPKEEK